MRKPQSPFQSQYKKVAKKIDLKQENLIKKFRPPSQKIIQNRKIVLGQKTGDNNDELRVCAMNCGDLLEYTFIYRTKQNNKNAKHGRISVKMNKQCEIVGDVQIYENPSQFKYDELKTKIPTILKYTEEINQSIPDEKVLVSQKIIEAIQNRFL